ncbi:hypothetical protein CEP53_015211 [Fusarium sp. AF-6]|nr:hypothetical protein CEP53_015211 [Fusarium sp. AF-6]
MQDSYVDDAIPLSFTEKNDLLSMGNTVLGQPMLAIDDQAAIEDFLQNELSTVRLKQFYSLLFLASNRNNISPLHQLVKGRKICITERPDLHLTWYYDRIFVKPIPKCLSSSTFCQQYLTKPGKRDGGGDSIRAEATGFLRTYARLIRHESDLDVAKDLRLTPKTTTWDQWCRFIEQFCHLQDKHVAVRYHYGEIRLTRLNFWYSLCRGRSYFQAHHNYATIFSRFGPPYLFVFGAVTVVLTALQTGLATYPELGLYHTLSVPMVPFTLILTMIGLGFFPILFIFFQFRDLFLFIFCYR